MVTFISLSSGSNGNCYYLGNERTALLVDLGIGGRTVKKRLADVGIDISSIEMILVTHDHIDHIKYLGPAAQKLSVPVFATAVLHEAFEHNFATRGMIAGCRRVIRKEVFHENRGVKFVAFEVPHDATETVGYFIDFFGEKFVFMTDLGEVPDTAKDYCRIADHIIIESNYDMDMLLRGPYSRELKERIIQGHGHLGNDQCASTIIQVWHPGLKDIFLCHLSENNNTPELAYKCAYRALEECGANVGTQTKLYCLPRREASPLFLY